MKFGVFPYYVEPSITAQLEVKVGFFTAQGSSGNQTVNISESWQPKVVLFWSNILSIDNETGNDFITAFGVGISSSSRRAVGNWSNTAQTSSSNINYNQNSSCLYIGSIRAADFVSTGVGEFTINWSGTGQSGMGVHYMALGGGALTDYDVGTFTTRTSTGLQQITGLSFEPTCVLLFMGRLQSASDPLDSLGNGNGIFGMASGPSAQGCVSYRTTNGANPVVTNHKQFNNKLLGGVTSGYHQATLNQFLSNGFELDYQVAPALSDFCYFLAMRGPQFKVVDITQPTSTGNQTIGDLGFTPKGLILASNGEVAANLGTTMAHARLSLGFASGSNERGCMWAGDRDAVSPTFSRRHVGRTKLFKLMDVDNGSVNTNAVADLDSFGNGQLVLNWTTVDSTQRKIVGLVMG